MDYSKKYLYFCYLMHALEEDRLDNPVASNFSSVK